jgi:serine protease Do
MKLTIGELPAEDDLQLAEGAKEGRSDRLGLTVAELTPEQRKHIGVESGGVLVEQVTGGAAQAAGMRRGDILLRIDNRAVDSAAGFAHLVRDLPAGKSVPVLVQRRDGPLFLALKVPE